MVMQKQHPVSPWTILGVRPGAAKEVVDSTYERLTEVFNEDKFLDAPQSWVQSCQVNVALEDAYKRISSGQEPESTIEEVSAEELPPKLGQLLVASGKITLYQLEMALSKQAEENLPLGEILRREYLITEMELDAFLLNQRLIKLPADCPHLIGQRLIGLGLVTEDMVRIALVEQRASGKSVGEILVSRSWLAQDVLQALLAETVGQQEMLA